MFTMLPLSVGIGMRAGRDRTDHAKRRVFLQRDAVIAAAGVGPEPVHPGNELDDFELLDFVIEPADFRLFKFKPAPSLGVFLGERLDDFLNLAAGGDAFFLQLQIRLLRRGAGFVGIGKNAEFSA